MKQIIILALVNILYLSINDANAQIHKSTNGVYKDTLGNPYNGIYKEFYEKGNLKVEICFKKGIKNGEVKKYFKNGEIHEIYSYKKGLMDGLWLTYNISEIKTAEANYHKDKKHGTWKIWDDNGKLIYIMQYKKGRKTGIWIKYDSKGKEIARKEYR